MIVLKMLLDPDVSKKMVLQLAYRQISVIGWSKVLLALLGVGIVGVSSVIKIPQIQKILHPKLVEARVNVVNGLSLEGISLETFNQLIHVVFNSQNNNPFFNYGESLLLGLQNVVIILLIKFYRLREIGELDNLKNLPLIEQVQEVAKGLAAPIGVLLGFTVFFTKIAPPSVVAFLQILGIPLSIISKLPQIEKNSRLRSTSHLLDITLRANLLGSATRVYTTSQGFNKLPNVDNTGNWILLAGYGASFVVNSVLVAQSFIYKDTKEIKDE